MLQTGVSPARCSRQTEFLQTRLLSACAPGLRDRMALDSVVCTNDWRRVGGIRGVNCFLSPDVVRGAVNSFFANPVKKTPSPELCVSNDIRVEAPDIGEAATQVQSRASAGLPSCRSRHRSSVSAAPRSALPRLRTRLAGSATARRRAGARPPPLRLLPCAPLDVGRKDRFPLGTRLREDRARVVNATRARSPFPGTPGFLAPS